MRAHSFLGLLFAFAALGSAFGACKQGGVMGAGGGGAAGTGGSGGGGGGSTTSSSSSGMPEAGPIVCTTAYTDVPKGECDLLQQDCPPGDTCEPAKAAAGGWTTLCVGGTGLKSVGETCYTNGDCDAKLFCVDAKCTPVCCGGNNEPCGDVPCNVNVSFGSDYVTVCHYAVSCQLLTPGACPAGYGCHVENTSTGLASCSPPSGANSPDLGTCQYLNDCADNEQCFAHGGTRTCHYYCYTSGVTNAPPGQGGCPSGQTCLGEYEGSSTSEGVAGVGLCFPNGEPADAGGADSGGAGGGDGG